MNTELVLPEEMYPFREQILKTLRPFIELLPQERGDALPWQSKIGGLPYFPGAMEYPVTPEGRPLWLLAQVNFEEMPLLPPFPERGLLQFFISDDGMYGLNLEDPFDQSRFRVVYHPVILKEESRLLDDFSFLGQPRFLPIEAWASYPLEFRYGEEVVSPSDYQFEQLLGKQFFENFGEEQWEARNRYSQAAIRTKHKMGGYAFFCQEDPRNLEEPMELLFQLGSGEAFNCLWGDMGVANFFICRDGLKRADFSRVMYNWDCY